MRDPGLLSRFIDPAYRCAGSHGFLLERNYLSPDGSSIVVPFTLSFLSGDDFLRSMRVIQVQDEQYAWDNDAVIYSSPKDKTGYSYHLSSGCENMSEKPLRGV